jgi:hypothetical protein
MVRPAIDNPASCEIRGVIYFLHAKNISAPEMYVNYARFTTEYCNEWRNVEYSMMGEQMFTMKSEVVGHLQWVMILFEVLTKKTA